MAHVREYLEVCPAHAAEARSWVKSLNELYRQWGVDTAVILRELSPERREGPEALGASLPLSWEACWWCQGPGPLLED